MSDTWKEDIIKNKLGGKRDWTEQERLELCHQLDLDIDSHINSINKNPVKEDGWTESNWREKMAEHPLFAPYVQENDGITDIDAPINELSEGLAQLKYDPEHNTFLEIAQNYKEEGLHHFKYKKYRLATASFSEGLKQKFVDDLLTAQLHNNRAAAQWYLGNYRAAIKDCEAAFTLKNDYIKSIQRAVHCAEALKSWDEMLTWCDRGLPLDPTAEFFIKQRKEAIRQKKISSRDHRKQTVIEKSKTEEGQKLLNEIAARHINVVFTERDEDEKSVSLLLEDLHPCHPVAKSSPVHLSSDGELIWPVLLLYPEYQESDCILEFNENSTFYNHFMVMFGSDSTKAPWDLEHKYVASNLAVFFEDSLNNSLVNVEPTCTLGDTLSEPGYLVKGGFPNFIVLAKNSKFMKKYLSESR